MGIIVELYFSISPIRAGENGPSAIGVSLSSFGHSGFTGTYSWVDPQTGLQYIFLSNRVYPSASNSKLAKSNLRTNIMQMAIEAIEVK
ncbi:MAG: serine hydrolase [Bacteroidetes bacterium]|nr:serine hydrolase [Bacteroidota bacterium]